LTLDLNSRETSLHLHSLFLCKRGVLARLMPSRLGRAVFTKMRGRSGGGGGLSLTDRFDRRSALELAKTKKQEV
jgi:hypothetical protein